MKRTTKTTMILLLIVWVITLTLTSCSNSIYWENKKRTQSGKHSYFRPDWGGQGTCNTYSTQLPMKPGTYKRYHYHRQAK